MAIRLAPISRREFLARSLATGVGMTLVPELLAAAKRRTDPDSWVLLSDVHLAADRGLKVREVNMTEHFTEVCREILALPHRPAGLFVTGDCAYNSGQPGDYAVLSELLGPLRADKIPVYLGLGNHDNREQFWEGFPKEKAAARQVSGRQVSLVRTRRVNWFILDSLEKTEATPGLLGAQELDWLARSLDANDSKPALVMVHHNPALEGGNMGLKDTLAFLEIIRPRKQVKAYIYGHTHVWKLEQDVSGIQFINLPAVAYVFQEGQPSGWVLAKTRGDGVQLELHCLGPQHKENGKILDLPWRT